MVRCETAEWLSRSRNVWNRSQFRVLHVETSHVRRFDFSLAAMVLFTLISLTVSPIQDGAVAYNAPLYAAPVVRPFEPPSNFGRVTSEGDGDGGMLRRPLTRPVVVERYEGSYEYSRSGSETAYDNGVANAERTMDARMGALDGRWLLRDADGRLVMTVSLMDQGASRPLEGAFRTADAQAEVGPLSASERTDQALVLDLEGGRLSLSPSGEGWAGVLSLDGRERAVTLVR